MAPSIDGRLQQTEIRGLWLQLTNSERRQVRNLIGAADSLYKMPIDWRLLTTFVQFWDPELRAFSVAEHRLVPTVEEFSALLKLRPVPTDLAEPTLGISLTRSCAALLSEGEGFFREMIRRNGGELMLLSDIQGHFRRHADDRRETLPAAFILALFGTYVFRSSHKSLKMNLADIVHQVMTGADVVPMILGELLISLDQLAQGRGKTVSCPTLLYFWIVSHLKEPGSRFRDCVLLVTDTRLTDNEHLVKVGSQHVRGWSDYFRNLKAADILWKARWMSREKIVTGCADSPVVPLVGVSGVTTYLPSRAIRQHGGIMEHPVPADLGPYTHLFSQMTAPEAQERIRQTRDLWQNRVFSRIDVETRGLTAEEREHMATHEYLTVVRGGTSAIQPTLPEMSHRTDQPHSSGVLEGYRGFVNRKRPAETTQSREDALIQELAEVQARSAALESQLRTIRARTDQTT